MDTQVAFAEAFRLPDAERIYRAILAHDIRHAGSLHGLGLMAFQTGRPDIAERLIGEAVAVAPGKADYHSDFGLALAQRYARAVEAVYEGMFARWAGQGQIG